MNPLITVIVPVYNTEKYLKKCIDSIIKQTHQNLEIILVDDGSTDESGRICDEYANLDKRVISLHKENGGQATARNFGIDIAHGDYIGFVDADDYISLNMYQTLYENICKYNAQIAMVARYNVNEKSNQLTPAFELNGSQVWDKKEAIKRFLTWNKLDGSPCDKLIEKKIIGNTRFPVGYICEDIPYVYELLKKVQRVVHTGIPMYYYLQRQESTSRSTSYSKNTNGLVIYNEMIRNDIYKNFKFFKKEADYFYFSRMLILLARLLNDKKNEENKEKYYDTLKKIQKNYKYIVFNKYFTRIEKVIGFCAFCGIYGFIKKVKKRSKL